jgi:hypothetical protein
MGTIDMDSDTAIAVFVRLESAEQSLVSALQEAVSIAARLPIQSALESVRVAMGAYRAVEPTLAMLPAKAFRQRSGTES